MITCWQSSSSLPCLLQCCSSWRVTSTCRSRSVLESLWHCTVCVKLLKLAGFCTALPWCTRTNKQHRVDYMRRRHFHSALPSLLAYCHLPRQYAAPSVPGHVQSHCGERGHLPASYEEYVQPQTACTQEVWPQGKSWRSFAAVFLVLPQLIKLPPNVTGSVRALGCLS